MNHNHKIKDTNEEILDHDLFGKMYFPNTYYNSLDFMYKYTKEVIIKELFGVNKDFFKRINSNLEDHRFSREKSIKTNSLFNSIYPNMFINITQDFSGPGKRTTMAQSSLLYILNPDMMMRTVFEEQSMSIQLSSNIYKYEINFNFRFDTAMNASNFISKVYNRVHMNKHFYPQYSNLRYRLDKAIYRTIRKAYKSEFEDEEDFLEYMDNHSFKKIIREFDRATGNEEYYMLLPIRPLLVIRNPVQTDDNTNGARESIVSMTLEAEIELPSSLYFNAPYKLLKEILLDIHAIELKDELNKKIETEYNQNGEKIDKEYYLIKMENQVDVDQKLVVMPNINLEEMDILYKDIYTSTLMINEDMDILCIDDPVFVKYLYKENKNNKDRYVLKIYNENGDEIVPREVKVFEKYIDIILLDSINDTILTIKLFDKYNKERQ